jgi:hypothetical protein
MYSAFELKLRTYAKVNIYRIICLQSNPELMLEPYDNKLRATNAETDPPPTPGQPPIPCYPQLHHELHGSSSWC